MGAGCSSDKSVEAPAAHGARAKSTTLQRQGSGAGSARTKAREDLAANFVAEFPADDDPDEPPSYPDGSREATLLKVYILLDTENRGYIEVPVWRDYALQAGLTTEALGKELTLIIADQSTQGDPKVTARQFVSAMVRMVADYDDQAFGQFVAQTLVAYRAKGASRFFTPVEEGQVASQA